MYNLKAFSTSLTKWLSFCSVDWGEQGMINDINIFQSPAFMFL